MTDLQLDPATRDLALDATGSPYLTATLADAVRQQLDIRFRLFRGEWFLDKRVGFPWREHFLGQKPLDAVINADVTATILGVPGVDSITSLDTSFAGTPRKLSIRAAVKLTDGTNLPVDREFIIP